MIFVVGSFCSVFDESKGRGFGGGGLYTDGHLHHSFFLSLFPLLLLVIWISWDFHGMSDVDHAHVEMSDRL